MIKQSFQKPIPSLVFALCMNLIKDMPLNIRSTIASLKEDQLFVMEPTLGRYILSKMKRFPDDQLQRLVDDCKLLNKGQTEGLNEIQTVLKTVWQVLRKTY